MKKAVLLIGILFLYMYAICQHATVECISGDCKNGHGVLKYQRTGTILEADFINGQFNKGVLRFSNGDIYSGYFKKTLYDSLGYMYKHSTKDYLVGYFQKGDFQNGFTYSPEKGVRKVEGKIEHPDTSPVKNLSPVFAKGLITGQCIDGDCKNGRSVWLFPDSTILKYTANQAYYEIACIEYNDETTYYGGLNNLTMHGYGFYQADSLNWQIGMFRNGIFNEGFQCENGEVKHFNGVTDGVINSVQNYIRKKNKLNK